MHCDTMLYVVAFMAYIKIPFAQCTSACPCGTRLNASTGSTTLLAVKRGYNYTRARSKRQH